MDSNVQIFGWEKEWTQFASDMEAKYSQTAPLFKELLDLQLEHNIYHQMEKIDAVMNLASKFVELKLISPETIPILKSSKFRTFPLFCFPFWRFSKTLVDFACNYKQDYIGQINSSTKIPADIKLTLLTFAQSLDSELPINLLSKGTNQLSHQEKMDINQIFDSVKTFDLYNPPFDLDRTIDSIYNTKIRGDLGEMALETENKNKVFDIFTSAECPGGGVFSLTTHGGQEESIHYKHLSLCLISSLKIGKPNFDIQSNSGKCTWNAIFNPIQQLIYFCYDSKHNNYFQYHASLKRDIKDMPSEDTEIRDFCRSLFSSESLAKQNGLYLVSGERGCGIYGGRIKSLVKAASLVLTNRTTMCIWKLDDWSIHG